MNAHGLKFGVDIMPSRTMIARPGQGDQPTEFGNLWSFANDAPTNESAFFDPAPARSPTWRLMPAPSTMACFPGRLEGSGRI